MYNLKDHRRYHKVLPCPDPDEASQAHKVYQGDVGIQRFLDVPKAVNILIDISLF